MRRITAVEAVVYRQAVHHRGATPTLAGVPRRAFDTLLVRVEAEGGLVGWGECFALYDSWPVVREALLRIAGPGAIGMDALDPAGTAQAILRRFHGLGASGPFVHAVSGLETALWDIKGKAAGLPLHRLLGGAACDSLPAYASLPRYGSADAVAPPPRRAGYRRAPSGSSARLPQTMRNSHRPSAADRGRGNAPRPRSAADGRCELRMV